MSNVTGMGFGADLRGLPISFDAASAGQTLPNSMASFTNFLPSDTPVDAKTSALSLSNSTTAMSGVGNFAQPYQNMSVETLITLQAQPSVGSSQPTGICQPAGQITGPQSGPTGISQPTDLTGISKPAGSPTAPGAGPTGIDQSATVSDATSQSAFAPPANLSGIFGPTDYSSALLNSKLLEILS